MSFYYVVLPIAFGIFALLLISLCVRRFLVLRKRALPVWRRIIAYGFYGGAVLMLALLTITSSYNAVTGAVFRTRNPPSGAFYQVDGYRMHIDCTGSGSPTVILESGFGNDSTIWGGLQPPLSKASQICSYDKAGWGWSEAHPGARDADHIATELRGLLAAARIDGPIVLAGHSIVGLYMRDYATRYPGQIKGIVFIDGSTPDQEHDPALKGNPLSFLKKVLFESEYVLGIQRPLGACSMKPPGFEARAAKLLAEDVCRSPFSAVWREADAFSQSGDETIHTGPYGDLPILIFSHDPDERNSGLTPQAEAAWNRMQENLKQLSTRSRRVIAKGSSHYVQFDRHELLEREIPIFIEQIRGDHPWPAQFGTTTVE
jgi:pimeloyl-ACP methyl ester carboxylesterase